MLPWLCAATRQADVCLAELLGLTLAKMQRGVEDGLSFDRLGWVAEHPQQVLRGATEAKSEHFN